MLRIVGPFFKHMLLFTYYNANTHRTLSCEVVYCLALCLIGKTMLIWIFIQPIDVHKYIQYTCVNYEDKGLESLRGFFRNIYYT